MVNYDDIKVDDGSPLTPIQLVLEYTLIAIWVGLLVALPLAALYALVRFVHWAWY